MRFDSNVDPNLPWRFEPLEREVKVRLGEEQLVHYRVTNVSQRPIVGTSIYNVTPEPAGPWFNKLQCFCFTEQLLLPGQSVDMPVVFFVDPEMDKDRRYDNVRTITLSYTFFEAKTERAKILLGGNARQRNWKGWMNMADGTPKHPYHLVDPSPWPALGAIGALLLALGAALGMHPDMLGTGVEGVVKSVDWWIVAPGFAASSSPSCAGGGATSSSNRARTTPPVVQLGLRYGMILFIASEVLFFAAFFWAFFDSALYPGSPEMPVRAEATGGVWPPKGISIIAPFDLPLMNTLILLLSGTTVTWAHHAIVEGNKRDAVRGLLADRGAGRLLHGHPGSTSTCTRRSASARTSIRRPSSWRPASTASMSSSARPSCSSACSAPGGPVQAQAAFRLRGRRLVLALRRRGLAVPVLLHLLVGRRQRADRAALTRAKRTILGTAGRSPAVRLLGARDGRAGRVNRRSTSRCAAPARAAAAAGCSAACSPSSIAARCATSTCAATMPATGRRCS